MGMTKLKNKEALAKFTVKICPNRRVFSLVSTVNFARVFSFWGRHE